MINYCRACKPYTWTFGDTTDVGYNTITSSDFNCNFRSGPAPLPVSIQAVLGKTGSNGVYTITIGSDLTFTINYAYGRWYFTNTTCQSAAMSPNHILTVILRQYCSLPSDPFNIGDTYEINVNTNFLNLFLPPQVHVFFFCPNVQFHLSFSNT